MNKLKRTAALFAVILMILMLFPLNAFAASASVRSSASSVKVGDTVTVTVTISGNNIGAASGTFSYNSSVLQFVSGSGASNGRIVVYATGSGQSSLSASMTFKAVGEGSSSVSASISQIYDMNEASLGSASGSCSIRVASNTPAPTKTQAPTPTKTQAPTPTKSQTVKPTKSQKPSKTQPGASQNPQLSASPEATPAEGGQLNFDVNGKTLTVKTDITEITIPTGSVQTQININEVPVTAVTKYGKTLVYLTDETGAGAFYVYDGTEFTPFAEIAVNARFNVIPFDDSIEIPKGFTEARLTVNNDTFTAWINSEGECLIFAEDNNGQKGFFRYDIGSGLLQKYVKTTAKTEIDTAEPEPTAEPAQTTMEQKGFLELVKEEPIIMICAAALAAALLILITVIIVNASKLKRIRKQNDVLKSRNH